ncbi:MAG: TetR/AcrR family transcriptional regulator [Eubacteriales bacterium]|nr:TetR/AcrR family transcriptional regulator [Eubacteriales bacterium]
MEKTIKKGQDRRTQILANAEKLFYQNGYENTTVEMILEGLGCSKGSFYHHFSGKPEVLRELSINNLKKSAEAYNAKMYADNMARLNALLYHISPFRESESDFLAVIMSLILKKEFADIFFSISSECKNLLYPEFCDILKAIRNEQKAFWRIESLPELLWDLNASFTVSCITDVLKSFQGEDNIQGLLQDKLNAMRFMWQRTLDLPYGAVYIIRLQELVRTFRASYGKLNGMFAPYGIEVQTVMRPVQKI